GHGTPPQAGEPFGLGKGVTGQRQGGDGGEYDPQHDAQDRRQQEEKAQHRSHDHQQQQDQCFSQGIAEDPCQGFGDVVEGGGPVEHADRYAVGQLPHHLGEQEAAVGGDEPQHQPGQQLLESGGGLHGLVDHQQDSGGEDHQHVQGVGDKQVLAPDVADHFGGRRG